MYWDAKTLCAGSKIFFGYCHVFGVVTCVTGDIPVRYNGFEPGIIADLRPILRVLAG
jgi:hypothetical protein